MLEPFSFNYLMVMIVIMLKNTALVGIIKLVIVVQDIGCSR